MFVNSIFVAVQANEDILTPKFIRFTIRYFDEILLDSNW